MKVSFEFSNLDEAIELLQSLKRKNKNSKIIISSINFDNDTQSSKVATPDEGCVLVRKSKTIIINEDEYIPHMELYSKKQEDLKNIVRSGTMHDIVFGKN